MNKTLVRTPIWWIWLICAIHVGRILTTAPDEKSKRSAKAIVAPVPELGSQNARVMMAVKTA